MLLKDVAAWLVTQIDEALQEKRYESGRWRMTATDQRNKAQCELLIELARVIASTEIPEAPLNDQLARVKEVLENLVISCGGGAAAAVSASVAAAKLTKAMAQRIQALLRQIDISNIFNTRAMIEQYSEFFVSATQELSGQLMLTAGESAAVRYEIEGSIFVDATSPTKNFESLLVALAQVSAANLRTLMDFTSTPFQFEFPGVRLDRIRMLGIPVGLRLDECLSAMVQVFRGSVDSLEVHPRFKGQFFEDIITYFSLSSDAGKQYLFSEQLLAPSLQLFFKKSVFKGLTVMRSFPCEHLVAAIEKAVCYKDSTLLLQLARYLRENKEKYQKSFELYIGPENSHVTIDLHAMRLQEGRLELSDFDIVVLQDMLDLAIVMLYSNRPPVMPERDYEKEPCFVYCEQRDEREVYFSCQGSLDDKRRIMSVIREQSRLLETAMPVAHYRPAIEEDDSTVTWNKEVVTVFLRELKEHILRQIRSGSEDPINKDKAKNLLIALVCVGYSQANDTGLARLPDYIRWSTEEKQLYGLLSAIAHENGMLDEVAVMPVVDSILNDEKFSLATIKPIFQQLSLSSSVQVRARVTGAAVQFSEQILLECMTKCLLSMASQATLQQGQPIMSTSYQRTALNRLAQLSLMLSLTEVEDLEFKGKMLQAAQFYRGLYLLHSHCAEERLGLIVNAESLNQLPNIMGRRAIKEVCVASQLGLAESVVISSADIQSILLLSLQRDIVEHFQMPNTLFPGNLASQLAEPTRLFVAIEDNIMKSLAAAPRAAALSSSPLQMAGMFASQPGLDIVPAKSVTELAQALQEHFRAEMAKFSGFSLSQ